MFSLWDKPIFWLVSDWLVTSVAGFNCESEPEADRFPVSKSDGEIDNLRDYEDQSRTGTATSKFFLFAAVIQKH